MKHIYLILFLSPAKVAGYAVHGNTKEAIHIFEKSARELAIPKRNIMNKK